MQRIMVIGGPGSGKSTVARKIGGITGLPVVHIDKMYWEPGWVFRDVREMHAMVIAAAQKNAWVFEGNNSQTFQVRADRSDAIVFLDLPTWLRFSRIVWRTLSGYGRTRPDMAEGCPERFDYDFLKFVVRYQWSRGRGRALKLLKSYASRTSTYHLRSQREIDQFLADLTVSLAVSKPPSRGRDQHEAAEK